jgi:hypothetical protein
MQTNYPRSVVLTCTTRGYLSASLKHETEDTYRILDVMNRWFQEQFIEKDIGLLERTKDFCRTVSSSQSLINLASQLSTITEQRVSRYSYGDLIVAYVCLDTCTGLSVTRTCCRAEGGALKSLPACRGSYHP